MRYDDEIGHAIVRFRTWLDVRRRDERIVVFCHFDADGLAAGALFGRGLTALGFTDVEVVPSGRFENAFFSPGVRERLEALEPDALVVTDLGVHASGVLPAVPTLYVDHHRPDGVPDGTVISGYAWSPIPCSAWLAHALLEGVGAGVEDALWVAAVGVLSDLGDGAPWPPLALAKKRHTAKWLKEAVVLTNAARRATGFDVEIPLRLMLEADGPKALSEGAGSDVLHADRAEVNAAMREARRAAPSFSDDQPWALVEIDSPCQVHPLIAQQWRGRLPAYAVMAANRGYRPDAVSFSCRTARPDLVLPELLRAVDVGEAHADRYGHGHDAASGGNLPPDAFERLLEGLGL